MATADAPPEDLVPLKPLRFIAFTLHLVAVPYMLGLGCRAEEQSTALSSWRKAQWCSLHGWAFEIVSSLSCSWGPSLLAGGWTMWQSVDCKVGSGVWRTFGWFVGLSPPPSLSTSSFKNSPSISPFPYITEPRQDLMKFFKLPKKTSRNNLHSPYKNHW